MGSSSVIAAGTEMRGRLTVASDLLVEGHLTGELSAQGHVTVAAGAAVDGTLRGCTVTVSGWVRGPVWGKERVEILRGGAISGDVTAACVVLAEGSELDGWIVVKVLP